MSDSSSEASNKTLDKKSELKEIKYSLKDLLREVEDERSASSMAKQIVDQTEIQKMMEDSAKAKKRRKKTGTTPQNTKQAEHTEDTSPQETKNPPLKLQEDPKEASPIAEEKSETTPSAPEVTNEADTPKSSGEHEPTQSEEENKLSQGFSVQDISAHKKVQTQLIGNFLANPQKKGLSPPQNQKPE